MINLFLPKPTAPKKLTWRRGTSTIFQDLFPMKKWENFPASHVSCRVDSPHHTGAWGVRGTCEKKCCWTSFTDDLGSFCQSCKITWPKQPSWMIHWYHWYHYIMLFLNVNLDWISWSFSGVNNNNISAANALERHDIHRSRWRMKFHHTSYHHFVVLTVGREGTFWWRKSSVYIAWDQYSKSPGFCTIFNIMGWQI